MMKIKKLKKFEKYRGLIRDGVIAVVVFVVILSTMYAYSQVWPPLVVIESGSMMHDDVPFGRVGTIDPGDFTLVKKIYERKDIVTYFEGMKTGYKTYGDYGDVIVYMKNGYADDTPVIHRVMVWVEINTTVENEILFDIPELGMYGNRVINIPAINLKNYQPMAIHSGYITRGDNNEYCDQGGSISDKYGKPVELIKLSWIIGKARGEIPWFGLIKLTIDDMNKGTNHAMNAPGDCWIMLGVSLALIFIIPMCVDILVSSLLRFRQKTDKGHITNKIKKSIKKIVPIRKGKR